MNERQKLVERGLLLVGQILRFKRIFGTYLPDYGPSIENHVDEAEDSLYRDDPGLALCAMEAAKSLLRVCARVNPRHTPHHELVEFDGFLVRFDAWTTEVNQFSELDLGPEFDDDDKSENGDIVERLPEWKQETPRLQVLALLASVQGTISNVLDGTDDMKRLEPAEKFLTQAQALLRRSNLEEW